VADYRGKNRAVDRNSPPLVPSGPEEELAVLLLASMILPGLGMIIGDLLRLIFTCCLTRPLDPGRARRLDA